MGRRAFGGLILLARLSRKRLFPPRMIARILVAEDELATRRLLGMILQTGGFQVELARDGKEALQKLRGNPFDLIISDQGMPGVTGEQLAAVLHRTAPGTPLILLSGAAIHPDSPLPEGVFARLQKPVTSGQLLAAVNQALKRE